MAEKERSFGNWVGNVVTSPGKMIHTGGCLLTDTVNTATGFLEDLSSSAKTTANQIANCFSFDKKWYQKILNIPVAAGIGLAGVIKALVAEPILNTGSRAGKTVLNATTNTFKSTLGSWFSAKPVSDISFNTLKTKKKGLIKIDTSKFILDPNKSWVPNRGTWSKHKKRAVATAAAGATAAGAAAVGTAAAATGVSASTAANIRAKEISYMKKDFDSKMEDMKNYFQRELKKATSETDKLRDQLDKLNEAKSKLKKENDELKRNLAALQKEKETKKEEKPAETKPAETKVEAKPVETKTEEKPAEVKPAETKVEAKPVETKTEEKPAEVKPTGTKTEVKPVEPEAEGKGGEKKTEEKKKTDKK